MDSLATIGFLIASMAIVTSVYFKLKEIFTSGFKKHFMKVGVLTNVKASQI